MLKKILLCFYGVAALASQNQQVNPQCVLQDFIPIKDLRTIILGYLDIHDSLKFTENYPKQSTITHVQISPNSKYLAVATTYKQIHNVCMYDLTPIIKLKKMIPYPDVIWSIDFSPNNAYFASRCNDKTVYIHSVPTGALAQKVSPRDYIYGVAFSPNNQFLATTSGVHSKAIIWDIGQAKQVNSFDNNMRVHSVNFSNDGSQLLCGGDRGINRFCLKTNQNYLLRAVANNAHLETKVQYSPHNKYIASNVGLEKEITIIEVASGKSYTIKTPNAVMSFSFSPDGNRLAVAHYAALTVFDVSTGNIVNSFIPDKAESSPAITRFTFSPDGKFIACNCDKGIIILDPKTLKVLALLNCETAIEKIIYSPDGRYLLVNIWADSFKIWSNQSIEIEEELEKTKSQK